MGRGDASTWRLPRLAIDRDGEWLLDGQPVTHPGIVAHLRQSLRRDERGYFLPAGAVRHPVEVADAPFVVVRVVAYDACLRVTLNDGSEEALDPATLRYEPGDVPYCRVRGGRFEARLARPAAWQLGCLVEYDERSGTALLRVGDAVHRLDRPRAAPARPRRVDTAPDLR